jgi:hypothetical protein
MPKNRGGKGNSGMGGQDYFDTSDCPYCANGLSASCPYWFEDSDGHMVHDPSGSKGYVDGVILGDGLPDLPDTPDPDGKGKGKKDDDDDKYPKKKRFGLW